MIKILCDEWKIIYQIVQFFLPCFYAIHYLEETAKACLQATSYVRSRLTVVSHEAKEEVPCNGLSTNAREYFTRKNLVKIKNAITYELLTLALHYSR